MCSPPTSPPLVSVENGCYYSTALTASGTIRAWSNLPAGRNSGQVTGAPTSLTGVLKIAAGEGTACALTRLARVACWANAPWAATVAALAGTGDVVNVAMSWWHVCLQYVNGSVACTGAAAEGQSAVPAGVVFATPPPALFASTSPTASPPPPPESPSPASPSASKTGTRSSSQTATPCMPNGSYATSCQAAYDMCGVDNAVVWVQPTGAAAPFEAYCAYQGWALAATIDGSLNTWAFDAPLWTSSDLLNEANLDPSLTVESKLQAFVSMPGSAIRLEMSVGGVSGVPVNVILGDNFTSLAALFAGGAVATADATGNWHQLVPGG